MTDFVVLLSGHGSTLQALLDAVQTGLLPEACIKGVVSNVEGAYGLERAKIAQVPIRVVPHNQYASYDTFEADLASAVFALSPEPVLVLAGFMRILHDDFIQKFQGKIINIHPSLLPAYRGLNTYAKALAAGETQHGTTVHVVDNTLDGGPILAQLPVPILENDTVDTLKARVQEKERWLYPRILQLIANGDLILDPAPQYQNKPVPDTGLSALIYQLEN